MTQHTCRICSVSHNNMAHTLLYQLKLLSLANGYTIGLCDTWAGHIRAQDARTFCRANINLLRYWSALEHRAFKYALKLLISFDLLEHASLNPRIFFNGLAEMVLPKTLFPFHIKINIRNIKKTIIYKRKMEEKAGKPIRPEIVSPWQ